LKYFFERVGYIYLEAVFGIKNAAAFGGTFLLGTLKAAANKEEKYGF
jgi:hypothetical protein